MLSDANSSVWFTESRRAAIINIALLVIRQRFQNLVHGGVGLFLVKIRAGLQSTGSQGGWLSAASTLVYASMLIPAGYLVDRFGPRRLFFIGALGTAYSVADRQWM